MNGNKNKLDAAIKQYIDIWHGTVIGQQVKNMFENNADYESICDVMQIDIEDYEEV